MKKYSKKVLIKTSMGLQKIDGLNNSQYFVSLSNKYINNEISADELQKLINTYYDQKKDYNVGEKEADIVSANISIALNSVGFNLSPSILYCLHQQIFNKVFIFAGKKRNKDFIKNEWVLNNDTVIYSSYTDIDAALSYDFKEESKFDYSKLNKQQKIVHIAEFISSIWQIHPFNEGNTRTIAVFLIKYLRYLGFEVDIKPFEQHSWYFRNALVRANYKKESLDIYEDKSFLIQFLSNLSLQTKYSLKNRNLHIYADINNTGLTNNEKQVLHFIRTNPSIKSKDLAAKLKVSIRTIRSLIKSLKSKKLIKRVNGNKLGFWDISIKQDKE